MRGECHVGHFLLRDQLLQARRGLFAQRSKLLSEAPSVIEVAGFEPKTHHGKERGWRG
jgi:hypothetical protein